MFTEAGDLGSSSERTETGRTNLVYAAGPSLFLQPRRLPGGSQAETLRNLPHLNIPGWNGGSVIPVRNIASAAVPNNRAIRVVNGRRPFDRLSKGTSLGTCLTRGRPGVHNTSPARRSIRPAGCNAEHQNRQTTLRSELCMLALNVSGLPASEDRRRREAAPAVHRQNEPLYRRAWQHVCDQSTVQRQTVTGAWRSRRPRTRSNSEPRSRVWARPCGLASGTRCGAPTSMSCTFTRTTAPQ